VAKARASVCRAANVCVALGAALFRERLVDREATGRDGGCCSRAELGVAGVDDITRQVMHGRFHRAISYLRIL